MSNILPSSQACLNNRSPIADVLINYLQNQAGSLLEIGHGTCEHAEFLCPIFHRIDWYPSDVKENSWIVKQKRNQLLDENIKNFKEPFLFEVTDQGFETSIGQQKFNYLFTANTLHIMSEEHARYFCENIDQFVDEEGLVFIYGPFKYKGSFTSASNERFDSYLKERDPKSGIRDIELVRTWLSNSFKLENDHSMPANNQLLVFKKKVEIN